MPERRRLCDDTPSYNHITGRNYALDSHGNLMLDTAVTVGNEKVILTKKEFDLLLHFIKNSNRVLTFEQIYNAVWQEEYLMDNSTIFYHIGNLSKKIKADWIESVFGIGYRIHGIN